MAIQNQKILTKGAVVGKKAIDGYDKCCDWFGFKKVLRVNFAPHQKLFAKNATPEGYSVWMLAHSNANENFNRNGHWYNIFTYPDTLREIWFHPEDIHIVQNDHSCRVCFVKDRDGDYIFQGIYKPEKIERERVPDGSIELVRTFKRISSQYPIEGIAKKSPPIPQVIDHCIIEAKILEQNKNTTIAVDLTLRPLQKDLIGKKIGDRFTLPNIKLTYEIQEILFQE